MIPCWIGDWTASTLAELRIRVEETNFLDEYKGVSLVPGHHADDFVEGIVEITKSSLFVPYRYLQGPFKYTRRGEKCVPSESDLIDTVAGIRFIMAVKQRKTIDGYDDTRISFIRGLLDGCGVFRLDAFEEEPFFDIECQLPNSGGPEAIQLHIAYIHEDTDAICGFVFVTEDYETGENSDIDVIAVKRLIATQMYNVRHRAPDKLIGIVTNGTAITVYYSEMNPTFIKALQSDAAFLKAINAGNIDTLVEKGEVLVYKQSLGDMHEFLCGVSSEQNMAALCKNMCKLAALVEARIM